CIADQSQVPERRWTSAGAGTLSNIGKNVEIKHYASTSNKRGNGCATASRPSTPKRTGTLAVSTNRSQAHHFIALQHRLCCQDRVSELLSDSEAMG
ncbi:MAG TPA: hypothetical protein VFO45_00090, partial [Sphingomicrobium sp.]|nr:hypothetical protein [Sphingomicrobium sp.]